MKEFIIFVCTDSTEIFFLKLRSAGLNYNLPSLFTDAYCAGVSNKHCLLTFSLALTGWLQTGGLLSQSGARGQNLGHARVFLYGKKGILISYQSRSVVRRSGLPFHPSLHKCISS